MLNALLCWGTRPEQIKLQPVRDALQRRGWDVRDFDTGQSPQLTGTSDKPLWPDLPTGMADTLVALSLFLRKQPWRPDVLIVQGDTASAFIGSLCGFMARVPVAHVEAGLRTYAAEPWPEEAFRRMIAPLARWHFCPDGHAANDLTNELGSAESVFVVGNTVIDTLPKRDFRVLATLHRRENWGERIKRALLELQAFARAPGAHVRIISHPNWKMQGIDVTDRGSFQVLPPQDRSSLLELLWEADVVVTDSGGLQEEAAYYGKPCFVFRSCTERTALEAVGAVTLVPVDEPGALRRALDHQLAKRTVYGTGDAGERIAEILTREVSGDKS